MRLKQRRERGAPAGLPVLDTFVHQSAMCQRGARGQDRLRQLVCDHRSSASASMTHMVAASRSRGGRSPVARTGHVGRIDVHDYRVLIFLLWQTLCLQRISSAASWLRTSCPRSCEQPDCTPQGLQHRQLQQVVRPLTSDAARLASMNCLGGSDPSPAFGRLGAC